VSSDRWKRILQQITARGLQASTAICTALATVASIWANTRHFCMNVMFMNRLPAHPDVLEFTGNLNSGFLLEVDFRDELTFEQRAKRIQRQILDDQVHSQFMTLVDV